MIAASMNDGTTIVPIIASPTDHGLGVNDNTTGTDYGTVNALRDGNDVPALMAVSSADGTTPVTLYANPATGRILVDSA